MFERFDAWLIAGLSALTLFCGLYAWIVGLYQKIKDQKYENRRLRHELNEVRQENAWLLARCEQSTDHRIFIRDTEIDALTKKVNELETLLEQKWKGAKAK